jgi:ribosomal protein S14
MLRKIDALRRAHVAYCSQCRGNEAAMMQHLNDTGGEGGGAGSLPAAEHERLAALKKDFVAWLAYSSTQELSERRPSSSGSLSRRCRRTGSTTTSAATVGSRRRGLPRTTGAACATPCTSFYTKNSRRCITCARRQNAYGAQRKQWSLRQPEPQQQLRRRR